MTTNEFSHCNFWKVTLINIISNVSEYKEEENLLENQSNSRELQGDGLHDLSRTTNSEVPRSIQTFVDLNKTVENVEVTRDFPEQAHYCCAKLSL